MASTFQAADLNAAFKVQYADNMKNLLAEMSPVLSKVPFVKSNARLGLEYRQPVLLSLDQGFTCHGNSEQTTDLLDPVSHNIRDAIIKSTSYSGRSWISNQVLARSASSTQAFIDGTSYHVESLLNSFLHMIEGVNWYGQSGLAVSSSGTTVTGSSPTASATLYITKANTAPFLFLGGEGMRVECVVGGTIKSTAEIDKIIMNSSDGGTTQDGGMTIILKNVTTVSGGIANSDVVTLFRKGYKGTNVSTGDGEHIGIKYMLESDSVFGLDGAQFNLWKANIYDAQSTALSYSVLSNAVAQAIARGVGKKLNGYIRSVTMRALMPDYDSIATSNANGTKGSRRFNDSASVKDVVHGTKSVKFIVNGVEVDMEACEFVKGGDAFLLDMSSIIRVGSTEAVFGAPGVDNQYFFPRQDKTVNELRIFADATPFTEARNKHIYIKNIA